MATTFPLENIAPARNIQARSIQASPATLAKATPGAPLVMWALTFAPLCGGKSIVISFWRQTLARPIEARVGVATAIHGLNGICRGKAKRPCASGTASLTVV